MSVLGGQFQTSSSNVPTIASAATAIASNQDRRGWSIQNVGTNPLFVNLGGTASSTVYHFVLKGGSGNDDGLGAMVSQTAGTIFTGIITIAGTSPRYVVLEM